MAGLHLKIYKPIIMVLKQKKSGLINILYQKLEGRPKWHNKKDNLFGVNTDKWKVTIYNLNSANCPPISILIIHLIFLGSKGFQVIYSAVKTSHATSTSRDSNEAIRTIRYRRARRLARGEKWKGIPLFSAILWLQTHLSAYGEISCNVHSQTYVMPT